MKNMNFNFTHENLGNLIVTISSGEAVSQNTNIIPASFLIKYKDQDVTSFLYALYELFAGNNDIMTDIIGKYLIENTSNLTVQKIADKINKEYSDIINRKSKKFSSPLTENDGIDARIIRHDSTEDPLFTAKIIVVKQNGRLVAHIDEQSTAEDFRNQGLMRTAVNKYLPIYCASNNISAITLEAGAIDGVNKATLEKIYTGLGFERQGDKFIKPVSLENSAYLDENSNFEM